MEYFHDIFMEYFYKGAYIGVLTLPCNTRLFHSLSVKQPSIVSLLAFRRIP